LTKLDNQTAIWEKIFQLYNINVNSQNNLNVVITL